MNAKKVAYLTMADARDFVTDFGLSFAPMKSLGWEPVTVAWRDNHDWNRFDAVYICAPWDYPQHPQEFSQRTILGELSSSPPLVPTRRTPSF